MAGPALAIPLIWKILGGGAVAGMWGKDLVDMILQTRLSGKQLSLQEKLMAGQIETAQITNEENRKAAEQYLAMFQMEKGAQRKEKSKDRQMALIMAMLQGMNQMGQQGINTMATVNRPLPPMALTTLMRGM